MRWLAPLAALALVPVPALAEELVDGIAAQVGSEIVLVSEVEQLAAPLVVQMREQGASDREVARLRATVLDRLIERRLVAIVVRRAELEASESEVDEAIERIAEENGLDLEELRRSVEAQGLPFAAYQARIKSEIEHAKVMNGMVASRVHVEDEEVRELYRERYSDQPAGGEEVHLRHIAVTFGSNTPEAQQEACDLVEAGLARIRAGERFEAVAYDISESNPTRGGDIGWVHQKDLAPWMTGAIKDLAPGDTSDVIRTAWGCNLLQLVERRGYEQVSFEQARETLRAELFDAHMNEEYRKFIDKIRSQTYIERKGIYAQATAPPPQGFFGGEEEATGP